MPEDNESLWPLLEFAARKCLVLEHQVTQLRTLLTERDKRIAELVATVNQYAQQRRGTAAPFEPDADGLAGVRDLRERLPAASAE